MSQPGALGILLPSPSPAPCLCQAPRETGAPSLRKHHRNLPPHASLSRNGFALKDQRARRGKAAAGMALVVLVISEAAASSGSAFNGGSVSLRKQAGFSH